MGNFFDIIKLLGISVKNIFCINYKNLGIIMEKINIHSWLSKQNSATGLIQSAPDEVELDFSNVEEICLHDIERLLDLQKIAVFNEIKLRVKNMEPAIARIFEQTGLYKILVFGNSKEGKIRKRQGLAFD